MAAGGEAKPEAKGVGGRLRAAAERLRGKKAQDAAPAGAGAEAQLRQGRLGQAAAEEAGRRSRFAMNAEELRGLQAPLKDRYREQPGAALVT